MRRAACGTSGKGDCPLFFVWDILIPDTGSERETEDMDELPIKSRTDAEKEASHREAEKGIQSFTYAKPDTSGPRPKQIVQLVRGELAGVSAQIVKEGGENNLHYHTGRDGLWFVLRGRVRFYGVARRTPGRVRSR